PHLVSPRLLSPAQAIEVPKTMSALGGSCLVIPCKFLCPDLSNPINTSAGFWLASSTTDFVYHTDSSKVAEQYKGRTQLIGDLKKGNCSLKIDHLQYNDNGPFYFRIEMTNYNFSFIEYKVSIAILGKRYTSSNLFQQSLTTQRILFVQRNTICRIRVKAQVLSTCAVSRKFVLYTHIKLYNNFGTGGSSVFLSGVRCSFQSKALTQVHSERINSF
uniref:Immunoglobulin V-set domain-containing protein n=1 Tax=Scleropages formosus TaxID=113540 RepID=A0A8C9QZL4_SCLFO